MNRTLVAALVLALAVLAGCSKTAPHGAASGAAPAADSAHATRSAIAGSLRSQALIDSGNAAFRVKDFDAAARRYASAVAIQPDDPAAYYGLGMALSRLGRDDEARVAYAKARELAARAGDSSLVQMH
jgi:Flp pilus assembly protein TadD